MANVWSAAATASLLADYSPSILAFIGIGAAMQPSRVRLGDVIVADGIRSRSFQKICNYVDCSDDPSFHRFDDQYGLRVISPELPAINEATRRFIKANSRDLDRNFSSPNIDAKWVAKVPGAHKAIGRSCKVHSEQIFSWDLVLDSAEYRGDILKNEGKVFALDMESLGFYSTVDACLKNQSTWTDAIVFRGISDYASFKIESDTAATDWRVVAAENAANAAAEFLISADLNSLGDEPGR